MKRQETYFLIFITFISFIIRLFYILSHSASLLHGDENLYIQFSNSILNGKGLAFEGVPTSFYPPLIPYLLACFFKIVGGNILLFKIFQALLTSFFCVPFYLFTKKICSKQTAIYASVFYAIYISLIAVSNNVLTEAIFTLLFLLSIFSFINSKTTLSALISGVLLGLASLTRPIVMYLPFFFIIFIIIQKKYFKLAFVFGFCLTLLPWTIRNYKIHHAFVPITTYSGYVLYNSSHPVEGKKFGFMTPPDAVMKQAEEMKPEIERNRFLMLSGIRFILDHPILYLKLAVLKILMFFCPFDWELIRKTENGTFNFTYATIFPLFLIGVYLVLFKKRNFSANHIFLISLFGYFLFFTVFSYGSPRFRLPLEPLMIIYASVAFTHFYKKFRHKFILYGLFFGLLSFNYYIYLYSNTYKTLIAGWMSSIGLW